SPMVAQDRVLDAVQFEQRKRLCERAGGHRDIPAPGMHPAHQRREDRYMRRVCEVDPDAHERYAAAIAAPRTAFTTSTCCASTRVGNIGSASPSRAAASVSGNEPGRWPRWANTGC